MSLSTRDRSFSARGTAHLAAAFFFFALIEAAQATTLTWDPNLSSGANPGGSGTWDLSTTANWSNAGVDQQWTDSSATGVDTATFPLPAAGTVSLANNLSAVSLVFSHSGYSLTGANTLTLGGALSNSPLVVGTTTIGVPVSLAAIQTWTVGSASTVVQNGALSGSVALTKTGAGTLTLNANDSGDTGGITLGSGAVGGTLNIGNANALGTGTFTIAANASILSNSSGGALTNAGNNPIALNASSTFLLANDLNLGTGTVTFGANRTPIITGGTLTLGPLSGGVNSLTKVGSGTLVIDNATNAYANTTVNGGTLSVGTTGVLGSTTGTLSLGDGEFRMVGTSAGPRSQTTGTFTTNGGRDTVTLVADPAQNIKLTPSTLGARAQYSTMLYRGTSLGTAAVGTAGVANIVFGTAPAPSATIAAVTTFGATGTGTLGTTQAAVLRGALYDSSAAGNGIALATYDPAVGIRALNSGTEQNTTYPGATSNDNILLNLAGPAAITGQQTNTLQVDNVSGSSQTLTNTGALLFPANGLLFSGNSAIDLTGGTLTSAFGTNAGDGIILSTNSAGVTIDTALAITGSAERNYTFGGPGNITINGALGGQGGNGGATFNGPGTVTLNSAVTTSSKGIVVQGGTVMLGSSFSMTSPRLWQVAAGATLDMNGVSVASVEGLTETNLTATTAAGTITNSSATPATLTITKGSNPTSQRTSLVSITGNINLVLNLIATATMPQTLSGQSAYTGTTTVSSGNLILGTTNTLPVGTALTVNGGGNIASLLSLAGINQTVGSLAGTSGTSTISTSAAGTSVLTINGGGGQTYSGTLANGTGTLALVKTGGGTQSLAGANTYSGSTIVAGGLLSLVNASGSATGTGAVQVLSGGTLGGNGFIATASNAGVTVWGGGKLSPGTSPGILHMDLGSGLLDISQAVAALNSQSMLFDLDTPATSDEVQFSGATAANSVLKIGSGNLEFDDFAFTPTGSFGPGTYTLFDTSQNINGTLGSNLSGTIAGLSATLSTADSGHDIVLTVAAVPEPASLLLFGLGAAALGITAYRRRRETY